MIKQIFMTSILSASLILTGCSSHEPVASFVPSFSKSNVDEQTTSTDMMSSAIENSTERSETSIVSPIEAMTLEQLREELNLTLTFPMPAQNVHKINGDPAIYEMDFTQGNYAFTFRFAKTDTLEDISGMYYDWTRSTEDPLADQLYSCKFTDEGQGICQWMQDGYSMSLNMDSNASEEAFSELYPLIADNFRHTALSLSFSVDAVSSVDMYHYDSVPVNAQKKVLTSADDIKKLYETLSGLSLKSTTTEDMVGSEVTIFRFHLSDNITYDVIYCYYGFRKGELSTDNYTYTITTDLTSLWNTLAPNQEPTKANVDKLQQ